MRMVDERDREHIAYRVYTRLILQYLIVMV